MLGSVRSGWESGLAWRPGQEGFFSSGKAANVPRLAFKLLRERA